MTQTQIERRMTLGAETEVREVGGDQPVISGLAAVYYDGTQRTEYELWEGAVERIAPGAFDRAIREDDVLGLFNHDSNNVLGRTSSQTLALSSDADGLRYDIIPDETTIGQDVRKFVKRGDVPGSSFAFRVTEEEWRDGENGNPDIRTIKEVKLYDVGPVTYPAYKSTTATARSSAKESWDQFREQRDAAKRKIRDAERQRFIDRVTLAEIWN